MLIWRLKQVKEILLKSSINEIYIYIYIYIYIIYIYIYIYTFFALGGGVDEVLVGLQLIEKIIKHPQDSQTFKES